MPGFRDEYDPDDLEHNLSSWHTDLFQHQNAADTDTLRFSVILTTHPHTIIIPEVLAQHLDWWDLFRALVPVQLQTPTPCGLQTRLFLGSAVNGRGDFGPIAYIPNSFQVRMKKWGLKPLLCVHSDGGEDSALNRFTFLPGSFKTLEIPEFPRILLSSSIGFADEDVNVFNASWLSQANMCIGKSILPNRCKRYRYGVVEMLSCVLVMDAKFQHVIRSEGTLAQAHIFLCPISVRHEGLRIGLEFPESDYFYWSLDSAGNSRMTLAECDYIGLPRLEFMFLPTAKFWHEYHYNAVREFSEARGFNPHSSEVARLLGLPLVEIESEIRPTESNAALG
ncbi:hypothetical protein B0H13DRAFT_699074 [Mycena leptocephala]|nr:hypothetical protein B0H13DRAFT_699074 [Mycena leptocephala]